MAFLLNNNSVAMIPAAGFGKRLGDLTLNTPKPLIEVGGVTMIERTCAHLFEAGFKRIAINTYHLAEQIHNAIMLLQRKFPKLEFYISHEPEILDIGGGMKKIARDLEISEFLIFNPDILLYGASNPLAGIMNAWDPSYMDAFIYLKDKSDPTKAADFNLQPDMKLVRLQDKTEHLFFHAGISIYKTAPLLDVPLDKFHIITDYILPKMATGHNFYGTPLVAGWIDIGTPENLAAARKLK
jgi:MurNAc alpha-1-phosphate uridylyltransferase